MGKVRFSRLARNDLRDIWCWMAMDDRAAADRVIMELERRCAILRHFALIGRVRSDIDPNIRMLMVNKFAILYRADIGGVFVKRIVRASRDLAALRAK